MAAQLPLVIIAGQVQQLPSGDSLTGITGTTPELLSVWNSGVPEILFDSTGDTVITDVT